MPKGGDRTAEDIFTEYAISDDDQDILREAFAPEGLRKKLGETEAARKDLEKEVADLKRGPARLKALKDAGVDIDDLSRAEEKAIESLTWDGDEPDPKEIEKFIEEYDLPLKEEGDEDDETDDDEGSSSEEEEKPKSKGRRMADQTRRNTGGGKASTITPADFAKLSQDARIAFVRKHPDAAEQLKQGKEVSGITL